jgi:hypothetical protein
LDLGGKSKLEDQRKIGERTVYWGEDRERGNGQSGMRNQNRERNIGGTGEERMAVEDDSPLAVSLVFCLFNVSHWFGLQLSRQQG